MEGIPFINDHPIKLDAERFYEEKKKYEVTTSWTNSFSPQAMEKEVKKPLQERVQVLREEGNSTVYLLDRYLEIRGPSDAHREAQKKFWMQQENFQTNRMCVYGAAFGLLWLFYGVLRERPIWRFRLPDRERNPLTGIAIPAWCFIGFFVYTCRCIRAINLKRKWSLPPYQEIAELRAKCYSNDRPDPILEYLISIHPFKCFIHDVEKEYLLQKQIKPLTIRDRLRQVIAKVMPFLDEFERQVWSLD